MDEMSSLEEFMQQYDDYDDSDDEVSHLYDYTEYGDLYDFGDEFDEFSPWDNGFDIFGNSLAPEESMIGAELEALIFRNLTEAMEGTSGLGQYDSDNISDVDAGTSTLELIVCAHCGKGGKLNRCGRCKNAYYCSKEHQTANYQIHKVACRKAGAEIKAAKNARPPAQSPSTNGSHAFDPVNISALESGMHELLDMFQAIGESTSNKKKKALFKKVVHVCEQILRQGNPMGEPLPQVICMLIEAKAMLQEYEKEEEGGCCPSDKDATPVVVEDLPAVAMSPRDLLEAQIKHALHLAENDTSQKSDLVEVHASESFRLLVPLIDASPSIIYLFLQVPDQETKDAYIHQGIRFCPEHKQEECSECKVDHRLLNEIRRAGAHTEVGIEVLLKEQRQLQETERRAPCSDSKSPDEGIPVPGRNREGDRAKSEEVTEDLAPARQGEEEEEILCYFADFHIRE